MRGDANEDGNVDLSDAVGILGVLFLGTAALCEEAMDTNHDLALNLTDALVILQSLFLGGPLPAAPFRDCGEVEGGRFANCTGARCG